MRICDKALNVSVYFFFISLRLWKSHFNAFLESASTEQ